MSLRLSALSIDANDPERLVGFWSGVLGWRRTPDVRGAAAVEPDDDTGFLIRFPPTDAPKTGPNQYHFDLTSTSLAEQEKTVARALASGARHLDIGQGPDEDHVVLADPEGNEFCVIEPDNGFLADCGFVGALSGDGSREVGLFWSAALGWPLVWDQDQETAIRSPHGGPKLTWGGPPLHAKTGKHRWHLDLLPEVGGQAREVDRLGGLGARRVDIGQGDVPWVVMTDPDGHEFCVLPG